MQNKNHLFLLPRRSNFAIHRMAEFLQMCKRRERRVMKKREQDKKNLVLFSCRVKGFELARFACRRSSPSIGWQSDENIRERMPLYAQKCVYLLP